MLLAPGCLHRSARTWQAVVCKRHRMELSSAQTLGEDLNLPLQLAWIGNSFVFFNNMPRMLDTMLKHHHTNLRQKHVLVGGQVQKITNRHITHWNLLHIDCPIINVYRCLSQHRINRTMRAFLCMHMHTTHTYTQTRKYTHYSLWGGYLRCLAP